MLIKGPCTTNLIVKVLNATLSSASQILDINRDNFKELDDVLQIARLNLFEFYSRVIQQCDSLLVKCYWNEKPEHFNTIF